MSFRFVSSILLLIVVLTACNTADDLPDEEEVSMRVLINQEEINTFEETLCWDNCNDENRKNNTFDTLEEEHQLEPIDVQSGDEVTITFENEENAADNVSFMKSSNNSAGVQTVENQYIEGSTFDILGSGEQTYLIHAGWGEVDNENMDGLKTSAFRVHVE